MTRRDFLDDIEKQVGNLPQGELESSLLHSVSDMAKHQALECVCAILLSSSKVEKSFWRALSLHSKKQLDQAVQGVDVSLRPALKRRFLEEVAHLASRLS